MISKSQVSSAGIKGDNLPVARHQFELSQHLYVVIVVTHLSLPHLPDPKWPHLFLLTLVFPQDQNLAWPVLGHSPHWYSNHKLPQSQTQKDMY